MLVIGIISPPSALQYCQPLGGGGTGIAWLPDCPMHGHVASGALVRIMTDHPPPAAGAYVVRLPGQHPGRKVRVLTDLLTEHFKNNPEFWGP